MRGNVEVTCNEGTTVFAKDLATGKTLVTQACPKGCGLTKPENMSPLDLFLASLATCALTMVSMTAQGLGAELKNTKIIAGLDMTENFSITAIRLDFFGPKVDSDIQKQLEQSMQQSPVHQIISKDFNIQHSFTWL